MPTLSLEMRVDTPNWVSGVKFPAALTQNSALKTTCFVVFLICAEGAIYKIACFDEYNIKTEIWKIDKTNLLQPSTKQNNNSKVHRTNT